jgi:hypothetical protein
MQVESASRCIPRSGLVQYMIFRVPEYSESPVAIWLCACVSLRRTRNIKARRERPAAGAGEGEPFLAQTHACCPLVATVEARELRQRDVHCESNTQAKWLQSVYPTSSAIDEVGGVSKLIENRARSWRHKPKPLRSGIFGGRKCVAFTQIPLRALEPIKRTRRGRDSRACGPEPLLSRKNTTGAARSREQLLDR